MTKEERLRLQMERLSLMKRREDELRGCGTDI